MMLQQFSKNNVVPCLRSCNTLLYGTIVCRKSQIALQMMMKHDLRIPVFYQQCRQLNLTSYNSLFHPAFRDVNTKNQFEKSIFCSRTRLKPVVSSMISKNICRLLCEDSSKKTVLINKIGKVLDLDTFTSSSSQDSTRSSRNALKIVSSNDGKECTTLETQIMHLMDEWRIEDAINIFKESVSNGSSPDRTIVFNMLQQIAELGKVELLLELHDTLLKKHGLVSSKNFYKCLCTAIYTSGRVEEGMDILMRNYNAGVDIGEFDILFTLLATMIIKHFDHHYHLVESVVKTLLSSEAPNISARALLWKCFVLAEKFDNADEMMSQNEDLKKLIPSQVTSIIQSSCTVSHIDFNQDAVLLWLIQQPHLKKGLRSSALDMLIQRKCDENEWSHIIDYISVAMDNQVKVQQETLIKFLTKFFGEFSEDEFDLWKNIGDHIKTVDSD